ncbi:SRPBCC family protein [Streptomyces sp. NPDC048404]|uniref:SRPBCC family protein n=1 Tax=unclassified Streptomyces TaxID=2593676 RepID=UPI00342B19DC
MHRARHTVAVAAPPGVVYGLLADAPRWPLHLPSCLHVERVDFDGVRDRLQVWHLRHGRVRCTHARRTLHPQERRIDFELHDSPQADSPQSDAPQADVPQSGAPQPDVVQSGSWSVSPQGSGHSLLTLHRRHPAAFAAASQEPGALQAQVRAQLEAVREAAERWDRLDELLLSFEDSVYACGSPEIVYDFLYRVADWADLVPHVERAEVTEDRPGVQRTLLHTSDPGTGGTSVTSAVRLCFPAAGRIVHKQIPAPGQAVRDPAPGQAVRDPAPAGQAVRDPAPAGQAVREQVLPSDLVAAYYGEWYLEPDASGVRVACAHQVMLRESVLHGAPGSGVLPADARRQVREWLGRTSTEALTLARWHAESALRRLR